MVRSGVVAEFIADRFEEDFDLLNLFPKALDLHEAAIVREQIECAFKHLKFVPFNVNLEKQRLIRDREKVV